MDDVTVDHEQVLCEISPLVSYGGEGLEKYKDQQIKLPCYLE